MKKYIACIENIKDNYLIVNLSNTHKFQYKFNNNNI